MNTTTGQFTGLIGRVWRAVMAAVEECDYASRRMTELNMAPGHYVFDSRIMPDTYAEFLCWTSGSLVHEPTAQARARGAALP